MNTYPEIKEKNRKKSVLIISEVYSPEQFLINDIVEYWSKNCDSIDVLTRNPSYPFGKIYKGYRNKLYQIEECENVKVHRYHILQGYKNNKFIKVLNYFWNICISVIITIVKFRSTRNIFIYHTGPLTVAISGVILKKISGAKLTIWTQDLWPDILLAYGFGKTKLSRTIINRFVRWIYSNSDQIIVTSPSFIDKISKFTSNTIHFVPNWPNANFVPTDNNLVESKLKPFYFTFAGNIGQSQNLSVVITAFGEWSKDKKDVILKICGDGSCLAELKELATRHQFGNIEFTGRLPLSDMPEIYRESDVLIISLSSDEVYNLYIPAKFSTYLTSGRPIFGIIAGEVANLIKNYDIGIVSDPSCISSTVRGFESLYSLTVQERVDMGNKSMNLYNNLFLPEKNMQKLSSVVFE